MENKAFSDYIDQLDKIWKLINSSEPKNSAKNAISVVKIGNQIWMAENLNIAHFRNGDPILFVTSNSELGKAMNSRMPACCFYDFNPDNGEFYGLLYNEYAISDSRGLSPKGWHIPNAKEWTVLKKFTENKYNAADDTPYCSAKGWKNLIGTNQTGFNALPGGMSRVWSRTDPPSFFSAGEYAYWWISRGNNNLDREKVITMRTSLRHVNDDDEIILASVRCVRDIE